VLGALSKLPLLIYDLLRSRFITGLLVEMLLPWRGD